MGTKTQKLSNVVDQIVEWQSVVVADGSTNTTGVSGRGYFVDTSAGAHTVNLPASPKIGDVIKVSLITAGNDLTIGRNGNNINGSAADITTSADGDAFELVYVNASEGWKIIGQISTGVFIEATGGTITTSGDYKIHSFTGDGCFVVSVVGNNSSNPLGGPSTVDYLIVAGGAGGGGNDGGGGGAGGYRESHSTCNSGPYTASPLATPTGVTVSATTYPITVGGGGSAGNNNTDGGDGSNSVFSTITSAGGPANRKGEDGGSGGGAGNGGGGAGPGGSGNTPPTSPPQGNKGGDATGTYPITPGDRAGGGGGGAATTGSNSSTGTAGAGGNGTPTNITGSGVTYSGGGGGGGRSSGGSGGSGGGGAGANTSTTATAGSANTGGGGGGAGEGSPGCRSAAGGSGIVIIRYKFQ